MIFSRKTTADSTIGRSLFKNNKVIMPFIYDFHDAPDEMHTTTVSPKGWNCPVVVEYVVAHAHDYDPMASVVWRVRGTSHCFTIYEQRLNHISHGDYKKHFQEALEGFAKDYNSWFSDKQYEGCGWRDEYEKQFGRFIKRDPNTKG